MPTLDLNGAGPGTSNSIAYDEGDPETPIAPAATVTDPDTNDFYGGSLLVDITAGEGQGDQIDVTGVFSLEEGSLFYRPSPLLSYRIGSYSGGTNGNPLLILFDQAVDPENGTVVTLDIVQQLVRSITFVNPLATLDSGTRTVTFTLTDPTADSSGPVTADVTVTAVESPPIAADDNVSTPEDGVYNGNVFLDNGHGFDRDPDGDPFEVTSVNGQPTAVNQTVTLGSGALVRLNADGSFSYDPNGAFHMPSPDSGAVNTSDTDSFTYTITGGDAATVTVLIVGQEGPNDVYKGNSGNNIIFGTPFRDIFRLEQGGNDTAYGFAGIDSFYFGKTFNPGDFVDGGADFDVLILQGDYSAGLTFGTGAASNITSIESISLFPGGNSSFGDTAGNLYSYNLTILDSNVAAGQTLRINGSNLLLGESMTVNGAAETDGSFLMFAGFCNDTLIGGAQNDVFVFAHDGRFGPGDSVDGGGGYDVVYLRGDYEIDFNGGIVDEVLLRADGDFPQLTAKFDAMPGDGERMAVLTPETALAVASFPGALTNVESVGLLSASDTSLASGGDGEFDYSIIFADAMLDTGQVMTFNGSRLTANETFYFDGSQESSGSFRLWGGAADDTLIGGGGNDLIFGGGGADLLTGGGGIDTFRYQSTSDSIGTAADVIDGFVTLVDKIDLQRIDANVHVGGDQAFTYIGAAAFSAGGAASAGELRVYEHSRNPGTWFVEGDTDGDGIADLVIVLINTPLVQGGDFLP
jgi:Ca2+-binding RTX toxin-like protein